MQRKPPIATFSYQLERVKNRTFRADVGSGPYEK